MGTDASIGVSNCTPHPFIAFSRTHQTGRVNLAPKSESEVTACKNECYRPGDGGSQPDEATGVIRALWPTELIARAFAIDVTRCRWRGQEKDGCGSRRWLLRSTTRWRVGTDTREALPVPPSG